MTRKILFRAWYEKEKRMFNNVYILGDDILCALDELDSNGLDIIADINDVIIEQYTGLKDKNGVEIYEGDRVKFYEEYDGKILYRIGGFFFEEENGRHTPLQLLNPIYCEVIGNIHEEV